MVEWRVGSTVADSGNLMAVLKDNVMAVMMADKLDTWWVVERAAEKVDSRVGKTDLLWVVEKAI